jgi:hypothetical protein
VKTALAKMSFASLNARVVGSSHTTLLQGRVKGSHFLLKAMNHCAIKLQEPSETIYPRHSISAIAKRVFDAVTTTP